MNQNSPAENGPGFPDGALTEAAVFDILSNKRRRECITQLLQRPSDDAVSAWAISHAVATALSDEEPPPSKYQHSVYVSLIQTHLPKLADHDVIEYTEEEKSILPGVNLTALEPLLDVPSGDGGGSGAGPADTGVTAGDPSTVSESRVTASRVALDSGLVAGGYLFASLAVAVVVLLIGIPEPTAVPDELRGAVVVLLLVAIGLVVGTGSPAGTGSFFE